MTANRVQFKKIAFPSDMAQAFRAICRRESPFILDSGLLSPGLGRYSIAGCDPFMMMTSTGRLVTIRKGDATEKLRGNPFHILREMLNSHRLPPEQPPPFAGGAVGYLSYDLGHHIERLPCTTLDDVGLPELVMAFHDTALVFDHEDHEAWIIAADLGVPGRPPCKARMEQLACCVAQAPPEPSAPWGEPGEISCNFTKREYLRAVQRAKDYIAAGDIFQVNLSRRFESSIVVPPHELFLRLRAINPAPMAALLGFREGAIISASPERFLKVRGCRVETRPIKGTRPRGATPEADQALAQELLASEKDNAELAMIVDLERNDLGRVCSYGSVKVAMPRALKTYPTVHHLVATVEGEMHERYDLIDLLKATFPGGSITGAPKIRAMEIIDELEPTRRSVYTGAIGYIGFDGSMDLNLAIRTFLAREGRLTFQAGGGIVADSNLEMEYDETLHKARALIEVVSG